MAKSDNLHKAKETKNNEFFYTRLEDIESEISQHKVYIKQFEGKTVLCNCDGPEISVKRFVLTLRHMILIFNADIFIHSMQNNASHVSMMGGTV